MKTTLKMLWVEDDYDILKAKLFPLSKKGWEVTPCTNFRDAVPLLSLNFDVYLIDLILPHLGIDVEEDRESSGDPRYLGLSLIELIRDARGPSVPVIAFSVVHDPVVDQMLDQLFVDLRFSKGTNISNREICDSIGSLF